MSNQYTVITTLDNKAHIAAPDGAPHRYYTPGDDAETLADCLRLATDEAARLNNVGVTYRLERWIPEHDEASFIPAHWSPKESHNNQAEAVSRRDCRNKLGELWRVIRQTREVLP